MILPNLVIAGAPKCGTTALFNYLSNHPEVCPASKKETYYLIDPGYALFDKEVNFANGGIEGYSRYFSHCSDENTTVYMEATPDYLYQKTPLEVFNQLDLSPKVILLLRKPSARIYSMYQFARNNMATLSKDVGFSEFVAMVDNDSDSIERTPLLRRVIEQSRYELYIPSWINAVGEKNIKVYLFENMISDSIGTMHDICNFLGIDPHFYDEYTFEKSNESYEVKSQILHKMMRKIHTYINVSLIRSIGRKLYHKFNLKYGSIVKTDDDLRILEDLDSRFEDTYQYLTESLGMDLSLWRNN